ncbi:MAG: hypothetical protein AAGF74_09720 [Pseudomonadota bacterium]
MSGGKTIHLYLDAGLLRRVAGGKQNFFAQLTGALEDLGHRVKLHRSTPWQRGAARFRQGFSLTHMESPTGPVGLTCRLAYAYPFWKIEKTAQRWKFDVAKAAFDPAAVDTDKAHAFVGRTRRREYRWMAARSDAPDLIYIALQGQLQKQRSFQSDSPLGMVRRTLAAFPDDPVRIGLHPKETYAPGELNALADLMEGHRTAQLAEESLEMLLPRTRLVVTENSSVAFKGFFMGIPAVTFARIDFHHIAASAEIHADAVFQTALDARPAYDKYLYWFLQEQAINAGRPDVRDRITARLRALGWDI